MSCMIFYSLDPAKKIGYSLWKVFDGRIIDGFGPDGFDKNK